ncbi:MAG TPA: tetratricopeptide repeat protein, partial [Solirubrobacterales bacterium]|nr:tetratricopeptide repeat protein [Solirubrobacterales bacterium]
MGKTTLLARCKEIAQSASLETSWSDEDEKDLLAVMSRLADGFDRPNEFSAFTKMVATYREMRHSLASRSEAPEDFTRVVGATAGRVGVKLARRIPVAGMAFDFVDEEGLGAQFGEIAAFVLKSTGKREDANLILEPLEILSPLFLEGLQNVMQNASVALFFDTFEQTQHMVEPWLHRVLGGHFGDLPVNILIAVAGRYPLDLNAWSFYEPTILRMELQPFSSSEARDLLARDGITESSTVDELIKLSHGLPILLASLAAGNPDHPQVADTAVERVLRAAPEPLRKASIEASLPRTLNRDVGRVAIDQSDADTAFDWLVGMPFVFTTASGWKYHDVIRSEFLAYGRRESPDAWLAAHKRLSAFYESKRDDLRSSIDAEQAVRAEVEHIYHGVCTGSNNELAHAIGRCIQAWTLQPPVTVFWAITIRDAERDSGRDGCSGWGQAWLDAVDAMIDGHERGAISLFTKALDSGILSEPNQVSALMARSDLYYRQARLDAALKDINQAIELRDNDPRLRHERAWVYWRAEKFKEALEDCEAAVALLDAADPRYTRYRVMEVCIRSEDLEASDVLELINSVPGVDEDPWGLLRRGMALRDLGVTDAAIRDFKRIIALKKGRIDDAWMALGGTYEQVEDFRRAVPAFRSALEVNMHSVDGWSALASALARENDEKQVEELLAAVG